MSIAMRIKAAIARKEQIKAASAAAIRVHMSGEYPPPPEGISQPRWLAMIDTVRNHFLNEESENGKA